MLVLNRLPRQVGEARDYLLRWLLPVLRALVDAANQLKPPDSVFPLNGHAVGITGGSSEAFQQLDNYSDPLLLGVFSMAWVPDVWGRTRRVYWTPMVYWHADGSSTATSVEFALQDSDGEEVPGSLITLSTENTLVLGSGLLDLSAYEEAAALELTAVARTVGGAATHDEPRIYDSRIVVRYG